MKKFADDAVKARFDGYAAGQRAQLMALRDAVFDVAAGTPGVGRLEETLKWGQPSYLTTESGQVFRYDERP